MPWQLQHRRHRTIPHQQDTELQHHFFRNASFYVMKSCLDYASLGIILPIRITTVAIVLFFLSFIIPSLLAVTIWIEEDLYTLFDIVAAVCGGYIFWGVKIWCVGVWVWVDGWGREGGGAIHACMYAFYRMHAFIFCLYVHAMYTYFLNNENEQSMPVSGDCIGWLVEYVFVCEK